MEEQVEKQCCQDGSEAEHQQRQEENILQFLDSMDSYITLLDSLSSTLRQEYLLKSGDGIRQCLNSRVMPFQGGGTSSQESLQPGWLELASARHSMGTSRIGSALFDLKVQSAATTLQVSQLDGESSPVDLTMIQPHFSLCKWVSSNDGKYYSRDGKIDDDKLQKKSSSPQLRHRGSLQFPEPHEERTVSNGASFTVDDQVQMERSKSLSVFGTLVSPKLRCAQFSFETALEALVEVANKRSLMLSAFAQVRREMESSME